MAEDRLSFPALKQGSYNQIEKPTPIYLNPFYYKYGGKDASAFALEEGGIGGKWKVNQICLISSSRMIIK